jgi:hypothetical protein
VSGGATSGAQTGSGAWAAAWAWSKRRSPLARLWRWAAGHWRPQRAAGALIARAGLPGPVAERIDAIVRRTRLWSDERVEVARELIAHAQDAQAAGRDGGDIAVTLGEPGKVGRLIRRAVKRKRGWVWKSRVYTLRALAACLGVLLVGYGVLAVRFFTGSPQVKIDYIAQLNARDAAFGENERAWRVYEDFRVAWHGVQERLREASAIPAGGLMEDGTPTKHRNSGIDSLPRVPADHPDAAMVREAVVAMRPEIDRLAEAARRPAIGFPYTNVIGDGEAEGTTQRRAVPLPPNTSPGLEGAVIGVLLPQLGTARSVARLLAADARYAAEDGDAALALDRATAIFALSRQLGREPFLIGRLVALAVHGLGLSVVDEILAGKPGLWDGAAIVALAHEVAASGRACNDLNMSAERMFFDDMLQRAFTDDGDGDGRLTPQGLAMLTQLMDDSWSAPTADTLPGAVNAAVGPVALVTTASRAEQRAVYDRIVSAAETVLREGPASWPIIPQTERILGETAGRLPTRLAFAEVLTPSVGRAVESVFQSRARTDATLAALAVASYRAREGRLPGSLADLTPRDLPTVTNDLMAPGEALRYRVLSDGSFELYSRGADGDDDGGRAPAPSSPRDSTRDIARFSLRFDPEASAARPDGDWVLFPPAAEE